MKCPECTKAFVPIRKGQRFCRRTCRRRADNRRQRRLLVRRRDLEYADNEDWKMGVWGTDELLRLLQEHHGQAQAA